MTLAFAYIYAMTKVQQIATRAPASAIAPEANTAARAPRMRSGTVTALRLDLRWQSDAVQHCDSLFLPRVDLARSTLPRPIMAAVMDKPAGHRATCGFEPGALPANQHPAELLTLQPNQFNKHYLGRGSVEPRRGRFYPGGILLDVPSRRGSQGAPVRVTEVSAGGLRLGPSHPLAGKALEVTTTVVSVADAPPAGAGSARVADLLAVLTANGPGMQERWRSRPTDFFADEPFLRLDDNDPAWSLRGLPRPAADQYAARLGHADPVYAVWARRAGPVRVRL